MYIVITDKKDVYDEETKSGYYMVKVWFPGAPVITLDAGEISAEKFAMDNQCGTWVTVAPNMFELEIGKLYKIV